MHPEQVKAAIRQQFGSIKAFAEDRGLPPTGVSDIFRGRKSAPVAKAIEQVLQRQVSESNKLDSSKVQSQTQKRRRARKAVGA